jgi:hypothetical protein
VTEVVICAGAVPGGVGGHRVIRAFRGTLE